MEQDDKKIAGKIKVRHDILFDETNTEMFDFVSKMRELLLANPDKKISDVKIFERDEDNFINNKISVVVYFKPI